MKELDKKVAAKRGRRWAATSFALKVWRLPEEEVKEELREEEDSTKKHRLTP